MFHLNKIEEQMESELSDNQQVTMGAKNGAWISGNNLMHMWVVASKKKKIEKSI